MCNFYLRIYYIIHDVAITCPGVVTWLAATTLLFEYFGAGTEIC